MSESPQPFTDLVTGKKPAPAPARPAWTIAALFALAAGVFFFLWANGQIDRQERDLRMKSLQAKLDETTARLADALAENETNQAQVTALQARVAELETEKAATVQTAGDLENEMRAQLESKDVTISKLQGKLTVNILDRVMFDSGEALLKPGGQGVMQKIAALLAEHPELKIHVIGHTDNVPIRPGAHSRFASNWELSTARALAAVHYLTEQAGVDPRRVGAVGYGEYRPIADNATPEGRAKNRRIAITILPDELAVADTAPQPSTNSVAPEK